MARYALTMVPWLWLLTQKTHLRIYQDRGILAIVAEVLGDYSGAGNWRLAEGVQNFVDVLPPRRVCSQYRETDYFFARRLLAGEGLGFFFEESVEGSSGSRLFIFGDSTRFAEDASSQSGLGGSGIRFPRASSQQDQDAIQRLIAVRQLPSAGLTAAAWDPDSKRIVAASLSTHRRCGSDSASTPLPILERYQWSGHGSRSRRSRSTVAPSWRRKSRKRGTRPTAAAPADYSQRTRHRHHDLIAAGLRQRVAVHPYREPVFPLTVLVRKNQS